MVDHAGEGAQVLHAEQDGCSIKEGGDVECRCGSQRKKICSICGELIHPYASLLKRHCLRQHGGENGCFLKHGETPIKNKYTNMAEFLRDNSTQLIVDPEFACKGAGRTKIKNASRRIGRAGTDKILAIAKKDGPSVDSN